MDTENKLCTDRNLFVCNENLPDKKWIEDIDFIKENFCGKVVTEINKNLIDGSTLVYIYGDIEDVFIKFESVVWWMKLVYVIKELSHNYEKFTPMINLITLGQVPININNVGVLFRKFFDDKKYFDDLSKEHQFQSLTESNKLGKSYRKGIYITKVEESKDEVNFNLLRCSTNLDGPTDNFRSTDNEIINDVNYMTQYLFEQKVDLNHVLAQIYNNAKIGGKEKKAKIKQHSDKTKDMPRNGLIAFCTFYTFDNVDLKEVKPPKDKPYDFYYKNGSVLTKLRFRLKEDSPNLVKNFDVTLYPNSVFIMSLDMNRLYTHETIPSHLPIDKLPTRLGYIIRCSTTKAIFRNNQTYIISKTGVSDIIEHIKLKTPTDEGVKELKETYRDENLTNKMIFYEKIDFSLNNGDYVRPNV